jgi:hypothetical protein
MAFTSVLELVQEEGAGRIRGPRPSLGTTKPADIMGPMT